jgi:hypothetical protein
MRRLAPWIGIALLLAGSVSGCQQPGGDANPQSAARHEDDGKLRFFEPEFSALLEEVVAQLERACWSSSSDEDRLNGCLRENFAAAFDDSRQGQRACDFHPEVSDFIGCVAIGNTLIDMRHRLSDDSPLPAAFWREEEVMIDTLTESIVKRGIDSCGISGAKERVEACVMAWFEKQVDLPTPLAARCESQTVDRDRYSCIVEGVMVRYLQDHVPRLGATST